MKIDGRAIAQEIYDNLKEKTAKLNEKGIVPHLAVVLVGDDPASLAFVEQKRKWSSIIGADFSLIKYPPDINNEEVIASIRNLNSDPKIHGIIVQRPLPPHINKQEVINAISPGKDIDGFRPDSPFTVPVAAAIITVLEKIFRYALFNQGMMKYAESYPNFLNWLKSLNTVVIGKGETAGNPIINHLRKLGLDPQVISSNTVNSGSIIKEGELVITAVGKPGLLSPEMLKSKVILLGVGMRKGEDGKLYGDYKAREVENIASYYTATTGGIGPVNVANLLNNLVTAAERTS